MHRRIGPKLGIYVHWGHLSPWYSVCTNAINISKGSYGNGEPKNVILFSVQKAHLAVRAIKLPGFMHSLTGPNAGIFGNSGLPFAMVPCFHQCNKHMERKLREWRAQKPNPSGSTGQQSTWFHVSPYGAESWNLRKMGLPFAMVPCFHQSKKHVKRKPPVQKPHLAVRAIELPGLMHRRIVPKVGIC